MTSTAPPAPTSTAADAADSKVSYVDVAIIGAGPAGCMALDVLSRYADQGLTVRCFDKRSAKLDNGQADGLNSRTLEIFENLGFIEKVQKEGSPMSEINFWNPDPATGRLTRTAKIPDTIPGLSRFQQTILHQTRVETHLLDDAKLHTKGRFSPERSMLPETLDLDEASANDPDAYPITLTVRHLSEEQSNPSAFKGETNGTRSGLFRSSLLSAAEEEKLYDTEGSAVVETVKAKYLVGCDGAHSWTRRQLGIRMIGDQTNRVWGVLDMVPLTNFPDIRMRCAVHSANSGSVMVIPQPEGLVRLYIQLPIQVKQGEYLDRSQITPESIMSTARKILHPYTLETDHIEWYTGYHIGQRMTESFGRANRIFLAGDACHTHSPKAGQGMNTSMQDTWNLCWKLASVLTGSAKPDLLRTYATEREVVAKTLIDFDTKFSKLFSGKPAAEADVEKDGVDLKEFKDVFATSHYFSAGMSISYGESSVASAQSKQQLAPKLVVGQRFFSAQVVSQASATADQLTTRTPFTGAWRVFVFPGDVSRTAEMERLRKLSAYLDSPESVVSKYTPSSRKRWDIIDVVTIHCAERTAVELYDFPQPSIFHPHKYDSVFVDGPSHYHGDGKAYEAYGISKEEGAIVVVRPDQYVALIAGLGDTDVLDAFFGEFMLPAPDGGYPASKVRTVAPPDWSQVAHQEIAKTLAVPEFDAA
ncbi:hypothetical protein BMF94_0566 [Rhodotorula taiwanensis]|uniref:Phenol 2-monooxygenase n=1 Tax=Rhodotorula taiwanensis TaxID=741276 RepID=A0A2S5BHV9_9BASI|nr:hypothetical protein BMF94_0566 [Rhodotorula taiwanensis]